MSESILDIILYTYITFYTVFDWRDCTVHVAIPLKNAGPYRLFMEKLHVSIHKKYEIFVRKGTFILLTYHHKKSYV